MAHDASRQCFRMFWLTQCMQIVFQDVSGSPNASRQCSRTFWAHTTLSRQCSRTCLIHTFLPDSVLGCFGLHNAFQCTRTFLATQRFQTVPGRFWQHSAFQTVFQDVFGSHNASKQCARTFEFTKRFQTLFHYFLTRITLLVL